jgi:hypothetical protein
MRRLLNTAILSVLALAACDEFALQEAVNGASGAVLSVSPQVATITIGEELAFAVSGGVAPYQSALIAGDGALVADDAAAFTLRDVATAGTAVLLFVDAYANEVEASVTILAASGPLVIGPTEITLATGQAVTFVASGGEPAYLFAVDSGTGSIDAASGAYLPGGVGTDVIRLTDSAGTMLEASVTVTAPVALLTISPNSVVLAASSGVIFAATGGVAPYVYSIAAGAGSIDAVTGAYTAPGGAGTATVRATDAASSTADADLTITPPAPLSIGPAETTITTEYSLQLVASGGQAPYSFDITVGPGAIDAVSCEYAPDVPGTVFVRVRDGALAASSATIHVVADGELDAGTDAAVVVGGSYQIAVSGGVPPYNFALVNGEGAVNSATGLFAAAAMPGGAEVHVTDALGDTDDIEFEVQGARCGEQLSEIEANDAVVPDGDGIYLDPFGIILAPYCSVTIHGMMDGGGVNLDAYHVNTGNAAQIVVTAVWNTGGNDISMGVYDENGAVVLDSASLTVDQESFAWTVDVQNATRLIVVEGNYGTSAAYVLSINGL